MDQDFLIELSQEGKKKLAFQIPLAMTLGDALNNLTATMDEVIQVSSIWKEHGELRAMILLEAGGWQDIFGKAFDVIGGDESRMLERLSDGNNVKKLVELINTGNKVMEHLFMEGEQEEDHLKMFLVFVSSPGPRIVTDLGFG